MLWEGEELPHPLTPPPYPCHTLQHDLHGHGQLHHKGPLQFWDSAPSRRPLEVQVFLFDLRLIITEPQDESGFYQYKTDCILVRGGGARGPGGLGSGQYGGGRGRHCRVVLCGNSLCPSHMAPPVAAADPLCAGD